MKIKAIPDKIETKLELVKRILLKLCMSFEFRIVVTKSIIKYRENAANIPIINLNRVTNT